MTSPIREKFLKSTLRTGSIFCILIFFSSGIAQTVAQKKLPALTAADQGAIIDSISKAMNDIYVFPDVARKMEALIR